MPTETGVINLTLVVAQMTSAVTPTMVQRLSLRYIFLPVSITFSLYFKQKSFFPVFLPFFFNLKKNNRKFHLDLFRLKIKM